MSIACIIVAAGRGTRSGSAIPKQYVEIAGKPVLRHTLDRILSCERLDHILVVTHKEDAKLYAKSIDSIGDHRLLPNVIGGDDRSGSVISGLSALQNFDCKTVLIHDAARPFVTPQQIDQIIDTVSPKQGAFLAVPVVDALWRTEAALTSVDRDALWRAQTPQAFPYPEIVDAFSKAKQGATDDVAIAISAGLDVVPIESSERNFKITRPEDFTRAQEELEQNLDIRTGNAFDVHAFAEGDYVILNGIKIPHDRGLSGHSDADVAMHAITDALFGGICEGDIGQWFPPSDAEWKGADSEVFLIKAIDRVAERGFTITHIDCTIICEEPKIGPHSKAMRENLSRICQIEMDRISVKATTSEQLGFTGRKEGIAALASATLVKA